MPPVPVDDHTQDFEELAGLAALDVLEGEDQVRFEEHASRCQRCRLMVGLDREALARAAPEMDPSPDFKARLMRRAAAELAAAEGSGAEVTASPMPRAVDGVSPALRNVTPGEHSAPPAEQGVTPAEEGTRLERPPARVIPLWRRAPWASAIAALLVVGLVTAGVYSYQNQVIASYALSGAPTGSAVVNVRRSGAAELDMRGVQNPPPGFVYEAWVIPPTGKPIAAGTMQTGDATVPLNQLSNGTTVAVTQEQGRVDAPTSAPIMAGVVQS